MAFGMMDGYGYGMSSGMWILGAIFWILILIVIPRSSAAAGSFTY
jgi:uncharacterized membrane protein